MVSFLNQPKHIKWTYEKHVYQAMKDEYVISFSIQSNIPAISGQNKSYPKNISLFKFSHKWNIRSYKTRYIHV